MVQFNLLPDVKLEYIRSQRLKRSVVGIAVLAAAAALFILIMLVFVVDGLQKKHLHDLNTDISNDTKQLQSMTDLGKILTIQNQLDSLPNLHAQKPVVSRLFNDLSQVVPSKVSISTTTVNFGDSSIQMSGSADSIKTVNQFADTLKFTTYSTDNSGAPGKNAFSNVVLSSFSLNNGNKGVTYSMSFNFDPDIFNSSVNPKLNVPNQITTRSETEKPTDLFNSNSSNGTSQ